MILVNTMLVRCVSGFISGSFIFICSCCLVDLMLFLVWCIWTLVVAIDGGRCLLVRLIVELGHVKKISLLYCLGEGLLDWSEQCGIDKLRFLHLVRLSLVNL